LAQPPPLPLYRRQMIKDIPSRASSSIPDFFVYARTPTSPGALSLWAALRLYAVTHADTMSAMFFLETAQGSATGDNMHSVKNRFLDAHQEYDAGFVPAQLDLHYAARDLVVVGACILTEHSSLRRVRLSGQRLETRLAKRQES